MGEKKRLLTVLFLALCMCAPNAALAGDDPKARALLGQISLQLDADNEWEACRLAVGMEQYKGTDSYALAEQKLLARGVSIAQPLHSYTIKQIVAVQNEAEQNRRKTGMLPRLGPRENFKDGWGMPLRVEFVTRETFVYVVRSAGPDKRYMTTDDLVIGTRGKAEGSLGADDKFKPAKKDDDAAATLESLIGQPPAKRADKPAPSGDVTRNSLYHGQSRPDTKNQPADPLLLPGKQGGNPAEREITLDELKEVIGN